MNYICDIGVDLTEIDDAFQVLEEKRIKEKEFVEMLALTLNKLLSEKE